MMKSPVLKTLIMIFLFLIGSFSVMKVFGETYNEKNISLFNKDTNSQKMSYEYGFESGRSFKISKIYPNKSSYDQGLLDNLNGRPLKFAKEKIMQAVERARSLRIQGIKVEDNKNFIASDDIEKISYFHGFNIGNSFKNQNMEMDKMYFDKGFTDAIDGKESHFDREETSRSREESIGQKVEHDAVELGNSGYKNSSDAFRFLEKNKKNAGVIVTPSGLQYKVLVNGNGDRKPKITNTVKVNYHGYFINGVEFDSSYSRGQPVDFNMYNMLPGWKEGLKLMTVGAKYVFYIPSQLAYGVGGGGNTIGPNQALIYEIELIEIK